MTTDSSTQVAVHSLVAAARALTRAARFGEAAELLDSATGDQPALAVARAEVAVANDWYRGTQLGHDALRAAEKTVAGDPEAAWDLDFLTVRHRYGQQFRAAGDGADLRRQAEAVSGRAPDDQRRGWAEMYRGLVADNVLDERDVAPAHYEAALELAEKTHDDLLTFEALRHLGDHDHDGGNTSLARERWERSTESAARAGSVIGTLAQQTLLAVLAREAGDEAGATMLAREVSRWAGAVGADRYRAMADAFLAGVDPTKPPEPADAT
jgi:tetratricopeptide (TPR) repeat protein